MKKVILLFALLFSLTNCIISQSMLCTYKGGYFIRDNNTWYNYKPSEKDGVWSTYNQYGTDKNYYYIKNSTCSLSIPKSSNNNVWIKSNSSSEWKIAYYTISVYNYCPVLSSQIFTYNNGFFVKKDNKWYFYIPEETMNRSWAIYNEYKKDDNFYYIKNETDELAIPRKSINDFFWLKNGEWKKLYTTLALYDPNSPKAGSGINNEASNTSSLNSNSNVQNSNGYQTNQSSNISPAYSGFAENMYFANNGQYLHVNISSNFGINVMNGMGYIYSELSSKLRDEGGYHVFGGESFYGIIKPIFKMNSNYTQLYYDNRTYVRTTKANYDEYSRKLDAFNRRNGIEANPFKNSETGTSSTNRNNNNSSSGVCSKCGGRGYESSRYLHAASSSALMNVQGNKCSICGYSDKHYHYPCYNCRRH